MKSMELTAEEAKTSGECYPCDVGEGDENKGPKYPWGLELHLNELVMSKLGLTELPKVGTKLLLMAEITVCGVSMHEYQAGKKHESTDLQITAMDLVAPARDVMGQAASKLYPAKA